MSNFGSVDEILDFAIAGEEEAAQFYTELAGKMEKPWMKILFEEFSLEEMGHKAKLQGIKQGKLMSATATKVMDLKIGDYLVDIEPKDDMNYQEALILAMQKEKAAFKLYTDLAAKTDDEVVRSTMKVLAQEEAKHKLRFEIEYDDNILREN